ncbi:hypothetical protein [Candidatus Similichlamydia laticola]|uniref:Uncharacterized protein n=1 Tax=Candidatus Similichlamydia laticola TaxID=2170265 RepID=A0A369KIZ6_9BACT|nr:hypothetical protein [Candidatus Similichlamydia laticola]RDB31734.1 hypothetical protein HAT2_00114 [Candidatus Similichlamydia laticola]
MRLFWILTLTLLGYIYTTQNEPFSFFKSLLPSHRSPCEAFATTLSTQALSESLYQQYPEASLLDIRQEFVPYLKLRANHIQESLSVESGVILWSLRDGEMVLNTKTWGKTHGLGDCLRARVNAKELQLLRFVSQQERHTIALSRLQNIFRQQGEKQTELALESCIDKGLLVRQGSHVMLYFHNPIWPSLPYTQENRLIAWTSLERRQTIQAMFHAENVLPFIEQLFVGKQLRVRSYQIVFLPIYRLLFKWKGETQSLYLNGITGGTYNLE